MSSVLIEQLPNDVVDARPQFSVSEQTLWMDAIEIRNRFAEAISHAFDEHNVKALIRKSDDGVYPTQISVDAWMPTTKRENPATDKADHTRERSFLEIKIDVLPFNVHKLKYSVSLKKGGRQYTLSDDFGDTYRFGADDAVEWALFAIDKVPRPASVPTALGSFLRGIVLLFLPFLRTKNKIEKRYRQRFTWPAAITIVGMVLIVFGFIEINESASIRAIPEHVAGLMIAAGLLSFAMAGSITSKRKHYVSVVDAPTVSPRDLGRYDSWHAVIAGLGGKTEEITRAIKTATEEAKANNLLIVEETYGYRTPTGFEERERMVVAKGQGLVHIHVYPFGNDVFVGWDAYLNWAKWDEVDVGAKRVRGGNETRYLSIQPGLYIPNKIDLIELDSLSEFVHRKIEHELRRLMKENNIDQEIDFSIIRSDRDNALDAKKKEDTEKKKKLRWSA